MTTNVPEGLSLTSSSIISSPVSSKGTMGVHQVVLYDPKIASQSPLERMSQLFLRKSSQILRRSLESERNAVQHLRQYGEGKIFVLLGNSTAGKTSIIRQLRNEAPEWNESGMDMDFPLQDAKTVRMKAPALYARMAFAMEHSDIGLAARGGETLWKPSISEDTKKDAQAALEEIREMGLFGPVQDADIVRMKAPALYNRMALAMEHADIARSLFGHREPRWKSGISDEVRKDAQKALEETRKKIEDFPPLYDYGEEHEKKMEETVIEHAMQGKSVIFDPYDEKTFIARMIEKNNFAHLKIGLAYCPFTVLAERVRDRNIKALASGRTDDFRSPLAPLQQFCDFFEPAKDGETIIDTLHRSPIEDAFDSAFQQHMEFLKRHIAKGDPEASDRYEELQKDHDKLKGEIMTKLGFSSADVTEVNITTKRKGIDYLFNTHVMKPPEITKIIHEWK